MREINHTALVFLCVTSLTERTVVRVHLWRRRWPKRSCVLMVEPHPRVHLYQLLFHSVIYGETGSWSPHVGCHEKCHNTYGSPLMSLFFLNFYWHRVALQCQFLPYSKVNQPYVYIFALFFGFPSHLSHHKALNRVPCPVQWVLISYLIYTHTIFISF